MFCVIATKIVHKIVETFVEDRKDAVHDDDDDSFSRSLPRFRVPKSDGCWFRCLLILLQQFRSVFVSDKSRDIFVENQKR